MGIAADEAADRFSRILHAGIDGFLENIETAGHDGPYSFFYFFGRLYFMTHDNV